MAPPEGNILDPFPTRAYLRDHLATSLVSLPAGCPFLPLLQDTFTARAVLQRKLLQRPAESHYLHILYGVHIIAQEQEKGAESGERGLGLND